MTYSVVKRAGYEIRRKIIERLIMKINISIRSCVISLLCGMVFLGGMEVYGEERGGGDLVLGMPQVARHLNPAVQSGTATAIPGTQIFATPLRYDDKWGPQAYLAESWSVSPDGLSVTLNLVKGAKFHDGKEITSEDVAFSIGVIKENHPFRSMFSPVVSVDTPDKYTAIIRLSTPHPAILLALSSALCVIIPKHVYGDGQDLKTHPANTKPVGSGPFKLVEYKQGEHIILEKNEDFFIPDRPLLDRIIIRVIRDQKSLLLAMEKGEIDMWAFVSAVSDIKRLEKKSSLELTARGYEAVGPITWLAYNTLHEKLSDKRVRQAIAYATDREFIINALHQGLSSRQRSPIIESSPYFSSEVNDYALDLDKANALLDEAGYKKGAKGMRFGLRIDYLPGATDQQKNIAEYLKSQLKKVGIDITVRTSPDFPSWAKKVSNHEFDLTMDIVFNWGDPVIGVHRTYLSDNIKKGVIWSNTQNYSNGEVDKLLASAGREIDIDKRKALYAKFQQIVADELPIYWVNSVPYRTAYNKKLGNVPKTIWGVMSPLDELYWKEAKK